jgi:ABC-type Na+ efflux pump permease subunit
MKIVFVLIMIILFIFIVIIPLLGFIVGITSIITSDKGQDWEGARYLDGK